MSSRDYQNYKDICKGVWEREFKFPHNIKRMSLEELYIVLKKTKFWANKSRRCHDMRNAYKEKYHKYTWNKQHQDPINQALEYHKECSVFIDKIEKIIKLKNISDKKNESSKNTNGWTVVSHGKKQI